MNNKIFVFILFFLASSISYSSGKKQEFVKDKHEDDVNRIILELKIKHPELKDVGLITKEIYDVYEKEIVEERGYEFIVKEDLNGDGKEETFISVLDKKTNKAILLILNKEKNLVKSIKSNFSELCLKISKIDGKKSIWMIYGLENENSGDLIWKNDDYKFIPMKIDY